MEICLLFLGAGISTAAGIGDFRGKDGKWTEKDKLKDHGRQSCGNTMPDLSNLSHFIQDKLKISIYLSLDKYKCILNETSKPPVNKTSDLYKSD